MAWAAATAAIAAVLFCCYLLQSRTTPAGPDSSSQVLQGWDMRHGNLLLHGWWVTDVSFSTTEVPQYALLTLVGGLRTGLIHVGGALTYTLLVLLAAAVAYGHGGSRRARVTSAAIAAGVMLAPQLGMGTQTLLQGPDHTGTGVPVLLTLLLIDRGGRRWWVPPLVFLLLTWAGIADALIYFTGAAPIALVCLLRVVQGAARHRERLRAMRHELWLGAAAVASVPAALGAIALIGALGGWQAGALRTRFATPGLLGHNFRITGEGLLELFGADPFGASSPLAVAFAVAHLAGLALVAGGVLVTARRFFRRDQPTAESVALTAIALNVAAFATGVQAVDILSTRDIAAVLPLAALLAGRAFGDRLAAARPRWRGAAAGVLACYAAMLGYGAAQPPQPAGYGDLAAFLSAHRLTAGISGYTEANIVTLRSGGRITLRPVRPGGPGRRYIAARHWNSKRGWYDAAARTADFVVLADAGAVKVTGAQAIATFGPPARSYRYHAYTILVYDYNLLTRLR